MATVIEFDNISKQYRLGLVSTKTLSHDIRRFWITNVMGKEDPYLKIGETNDRSTRGSSDYVWALRDINFKVEQGDVLGIIGKNGAGKSTLLKLLSKVTGPTTGTIRAKGRIGSLLEVGTGFHPEMTGRENIFLNGAILGMSKSEITKKLDEIVDFSGCERYIDTPVKRYSSGMMVRLGFAVAAHLDPEILVVDEVLAVGDAEFQKKAIGKMQDVSQGEGRTVLFVSHNMESIKNLCKSGIILEQGMVTYSGTALDCVNRYIDQKRDVFETNTVINKSHRLFPRHKQIEIVSVKLLNDSPSLCFNEDVVAQIDMRRNDKSVSSFTMEMMVDNGEERRVGSYISPIQMVDKDEFSILVRLKNHNLARGKYYLNFNVGMKVDADFQFDDYDIVKGVLSFEILYTDNTKSKEIKGWRDGWGNCKFSEGSVEFL